MVGFNHMVFAELLRRARCRSRSGVRPSKARAPSNTLEPSQKACVRGPTIALLPSNHSPSRKVWVRDHSAMGALAMGCQEGSTLDIGSYRASIKSNLKQLRIGLTAPFACGP